MKLSPRESRILAIISRRPAHTWTVDEIADQVWEKNAERPTNWRNSIQVSARGLMFKTFYQQTKIVKEKGEGRGNYIAYKLKRKVAA